MSIQVFKKDLQANGNFNNGEILEKKPIGFPQDGGQSRPYSNLFYWAHAWAPTNGSVIGLHPHRGFEICSFVLKGEIEHYDTLLDKWITLKKGDVQVIRAGKGISHSEKLKKVLKFFKFGLILISISLFMLNQAITILNQDYFLKKLLMVYS